MAKILHHGAVTGVTGSCHQLFDQNGNSILIDCGLFQGAEASGSESGGLSIEFPLDGVCALVVTHCHIDLVVTHCHIDHVGRLPYLLAAGFSAPIYATIATAKLLPLVIEDALKIGVTRDQRLIDNVLKLLQRLLVPVEYGEWVVVPGFDAKGVRFKPAGHILGSAYIECQLPQDRVVFSGDLGAPYSPLLPAPKSPYKADTLIIESTYGDRCHESRKDRSRRLQRVIERCLGNAGTVLIPAFSIGRTQELLYEIEHIIHKVGGDWTALDVVVDSPLAASFTEHYRELKHLWDAEAKQRVKSGRHPLSFEQLVTVSDHEEHQRLVHYLQRSGRPAIVIAASGMCAGGRIVNYLKALLPDNRTDVLFVGYQAKGTPGRDIQKYGPNNGYVMLEGNKIGINAGIYTLSGYSAHADQKDLLNFVERMRVKPNEIRIVHGDTEAKIVLRDKFLSVLPEANIWIPTE